MKALPRGAQARWQGLGLAKEIDPRRLPEHIRHHHGRQRAVGQEAEPAAHGRPIAPARRLFGGSRHLRPVGDSGPHLVCLLAENWKRPRMKSTRSAPSSALCPEGASRLSRSPNVRLTTIGRLEALPPVAREELDAAVQADLGHRAARDSAPTTAVARAGGRLQLGPRRGASGGAAGGAARGRGGVVSPVYQGSARPDLLIRTSGEMRVQQLPVVADRLPPNST